MADDSSRISRCERELLGALAQMLVNKFHAEYPEGTQPGDATRLAMGYLNLRAASEKSPSKPHSLEGERDTHLLRAFTPEKTMAPGYELEYWNLTMVRMKGDVVLTVRLPSQFSHYVGEGRERMAAWHHGVTSSVRFNRDLWRSFVAQIAEANKVFQAADSLDGEMTDGP